MPVSGCRSVAPPIGLIFPSKSLIISCGGILLATIHSASVGNLVVISSAIPLSYPSASSHCCVVLRSATGLNPFSISIGAMIFSGTIPLSMPMVSLGRIASVVIGISPAGLGCIAGGAPICPTVSPPGIIRCPDGIIGSAGCPGIACPPTSGCINGSPSSGLILARGRVDISSASTGNCIIPVLGTCAGRKSASNLSPDSFCKASLASL